MSGIVFEMNGTNAWYEHFLYPGGEMQVRIKPDKVRSITEASKIVVVARIQDSGSIIEARMLHDAIRSLTSVKPMFVVPYWPYARADRRFVEGDCLGLQVICDILNPLACVTLDIHSTKNLSAAYSLSAFSYIQQAACDFARGYELNILFPDEGARQRYSLPTMLGTNTNAVHCKILNANKVRDATTGKLSGFSVPAEEEFGGHPTLIVDDICDGGGTFVGIAEKLKPYALQVGLYVTHGIFSKGFRDLTAHFNHIYCTSSFSGPMGNLEWFTQFDCIPDLIRAAR